MTQAWRDSDDDGRHRHHNGGLLVSGSDAGGMVKAVAQLELAAGPAVQGCETAGSHWQAPGIAGNGRIGPARTGSPGLAGNGCIGSPQQADGSGGARPAIPTDVALEAGGTSAPDLDVSASATQGRRAALVCIARRPCASGTLVPYDITYYITLSFTVYDIIYDKSSL